MVVHNNRRMIMTVGDSRVGKSTVLKLLIDLLHEEGKRLKAYDYDNRQKLEAYQNTIPIESLNFFTGDADQLVEDINKDKFDVILADMPGQYVEKICTYIDGINLFNLLEDHGWKLTFLQPISHRLDCLQYMQTILSFSVDRASYIVVKNQYFDSRFHEYNRSMCEKMARRDSTEIILMKLHRDHYESLERSCKPYFQVCKDNSIYLIYRSYIYRWIKNFNNLVLSNVTARNYLGLSSFS